MIELSLITLLTILCLTFVYLYFRLRGSIMQLKRDISEKRETNTNLLLTTSEMNQTLSDLTRQINELFDALRDVETENQHRKDNFTRVLHNITHDIRTPLTIASGYTQSLLKESEGTDSQNPDREQGDLQKIRQNLDTVAKRLEILLEYQNLLELNVEPEFDRLDFTELVKGQLLKFYERFEAAGFEVDLQMAENVMIKGDQELLSRIMQNLLGNALKHGQKLLRIKLANENGQIRLIVENESQQQIKNLHKLTNRFYSENMSKVEASSGLGLYIVQELAALLRGHLELDYQEPDFVVMISWL